VSPTALDPSMKFVIGGSLGALLAAYLAFAGRGRSTSTPNSQLATPKKLPTPNAQQN
jgi:hypothetical protein